MIGMCKLDMDDELTPICRLKTKDEQRLEIEQQIANLMNCERQIASEAKQRIHDLQIQREALCRELNRI